MVKQDTMIHPPEHPERHEHKDIHVRPLAIFAIAFVISAVLIHIGLYVLFGTYETQEEKQQQVYNRSGIADAAPQKPSIPLQGVPGFHDNTPAQDMEAMLKEQDQILTSYAATNEEGFVRIPVERAMELAIQHNMLPSAQPTTQPQATGGGHDHAAH